MLVSASESTLLMNSKDYFIEALSKMLASIHKVNYVTVSSFDEFLYVYRVTYFVGQKKVSRFVSRKQAILASRLYQLWLSKKINKKSNKDISVGRYIGTVPNKLPIYGIVNFNGKLSWVYAFGKVAVVVINKKMYSIASKFEAVFCNHLIKYEYF